MTSFTLQLEILSTANTTILINAALKHYQLSGGDLSSPGGANLEVCRLLKYNQEKAKKKKGTEMIHFKSQCPLNLRRCLDLDRKFTSEPSLTIVA